MLFILRGNIQFNIVFLRNLMFSNWLTGGCSVLINMKYNINLYTGATGCERWMSRWMNRRIFYLSSQTMSMLE